MSWENSLVLHLNHWAVNHSALTKFMANDLVYLAILIAAVVVTYEHFLNYGNNAFTVGKFVLSIKFALSRLIIPLAIAVVISELISKVYQRARPFVDLPGVKLVFPHAADGGMPSHHTVFLAALAFGIIHYSRFWATTLLILTLVSGFFRVAGGVHYPTDILAGIVIGLVIPTIIDSLRRSRLRRR